MLKRYHLKCQRPDDEVKTIKRIGCGACEKNTVHRRCEVNGRRRWAPSVSQKKEKNESKLSEELYKREQCNFESSYSMNLEHHKERVHEGIKRYSCNICEKTTYYKLTFINHQKTKHESKEFKIVKKIGCQKCDAETKHYCCTNRKLEREKSGGRRRILRKAPHELNKCDSCDFETYYRTNLKNHIEAVHKDTKKFACKICDYTCNFECITHGGLHLHQKAVHLGVKLKCEPMKMMMKTAQKRILMMFRILKNLDQVLKLPRMKKLNQKESLRSTSLRY